MILLMVLIRWLIIRLVMGSVMGLVLGSVMGLDLVSAMWSVRGPDSGLGVMWSVTSGPSKCVHVSSVHFQGVGIYRAGKVADKSRQLFFFSSRTARISPCKWWNKITVPVQQLLQMTMQYKMKRCLFPHRT